MLVALSMEAIAKVRMRIYKALEIIIVNDILVTLLFASENT